ncbi:MAG TPA: hypothetical protein VGR78_02160 [Verrucomicrobiae bacterium]|jgi:hypothetical protein|nr:hypothetical protein [Verrucomicrobiae bacterium]
MEPGCKLSGRLLTAVGALVLLTGITVDLFVNRQALWGANENWQICHSCGLQLMTKNWTVLQLDGPLHSSEIENPISRALRSGRTNLCDHKFLAFSIYQTRIAINPIPMGHERFSGNTMLQHFTESETLAAALAALAPEQRRVVWENLCLLSLRPNNPHLVRLSQMLKDKAAGPEILTYLRGADAFWILR